MQTLRAPIHTKSIYHYMLQRLLSIAPLKFAPLTCPIEEGIACTYALLCTLMEFFFAYEARDSHGHCWYKSSRVSEAITQFNPTIWFS